MHGSGATKEANADVGRLAHMGLLILILCIASFLRFHNLRENPGWYSDEGSDIDIAANLLHGRLQYFAIGESPMIAARPLLFHAILAGGFAVLGEDILTLRLLTAGYGVLSVLLLYALGRRMIGEGTALLAAGLLAVYPSAILYSRFGFNYNQLTPLFLLFCYCLYRYLEAPEIRWLVGAAVFSGFALITNLLAVVLPGILAIAILTRRWRHIPVLLVAAFFPIVYGGLMLFLSGRAFLFDLAFTYSRFGVSLPLQFIGVVFNYERLWHWDLWFLFGAAGLLTIPGRRARVLSCALFFGTLFSILRVAAVDGLGFYRLIPLFPYVALGMAALMVRGLPGLLFTIRNDVTVVLHKLGFARQRRYLNWLYWRGVHLAVALAWFVTLLSPLLVVVVLDVNQAVTWFPTRFGRSIAQNPAQAQQVIDYLNTHTAPGEVVLGSPHLIWALDAPAADFQQALAYDGIETEHLPGNIPRHRFQFDCSYANARYIILDPLWRGWASEAMPGVRDLVSRVETWPLEIEIGDFQVYRNPVQGGIITR